MIFFKDANIFLFMEGFMDLSGKKVLVVTSTDNMISQFLIPHIQDMQKMGATVECACNETDFFFETLKNEYGFTMHKLDIPRKPLSFKLFRAKDELVKLIKKNKYDLIHCQQPVGGVLARMAGHQCKVPVLYIAHGFHFFKGAPLQNKLIYKTIETEMAKKTDALVTMNEEDFSSAKKMKAKKIYKINGIGVDLDKYKLNEELDEVAFRKSLGVEKDDFLILSVAEFTINKNIISIIKAIEDNPNKKIKLILCGRGELQERLKEYVNSHNLQDRVLFLGYRNDISNCIQVSNAVILVSFREGLPKSFLEAMSVGKPLIGSDIRGIKDLIGNNEGGVLIDPYDVATIKNAIQKLYEDKTLCKKFGERNKEFVKNYSIDVVLEQMREIYKNI
ncbi:MAG: glycosyltransferase family 1 protein [Clostridia bacterium]|nr:glycosyltransferase family 1 protein [Clostridia bacterium]